MKTLTQFLFFIICLTCYAQSHTWTGNGTNNLWSNPENWDALTVPDGSSTVLINGAGEIVLALGANNGATIVIEQGAKLVVEGSLTTQETTVNAAEIEILLGATYSNPGGTITIQENAKLVVEGLLDIPGTNTVVTGSDSELTIDIDASANNNGATIVIEQGAKLVVDGTFNSSNGGNINNSSTVEIGVNGLLSNEGGTITIQNGAKLVVEGELTSDSSGTFDNFGTIEGNGILDITGTFNNEGAISPGGEGIIGTIHFLNNFSLNNGILVTDILNVSEHDSIEVLGTAYLEGDVEVSLYLPGGFGDDYTIVSASNPILTCNFPAEIYYQIDPQETIILETICEDNAFKLAYGGIIFLDVDQYDLEQKIAVAPNPVTQTSTITIPSTFLDSATTLSLFATTGQLVVRKFIASPSVNLDTTTLSDGVYLLRIENNNGFLTEKIIKQAQ
ncbi:T9SS type A sorting domain-containing protein [Marinirhabdus gelatinilytica]|uniref:Putative secreted protein (Por secretion system target) n=1 Tax=Marinirhabdus gelatinilytica TaxID=1703343 RepID=A0A370QL17_9FLAO|nr:T9SS type A sorting domain-containing protein [Marinirhabdus gelatinilytica]RDK89029.1 putative secreted protein (Por secretion system target) [Marinirhabdus gelatinilytica]